MLIDADAVRVAEAIGDCCALIAVAEQELHDAERTRLATKGIDDVDALIAALLAIIADLHQAVETALPSEELLTTAPQLDADTLLAKADEIYLANAAPPGSPPDRAALAGLIARAQFLDAWFAPVFDPLMAAGFAQSALRDVFALDACVTLADGALLLPRRLGPWRQDFDLSGADETEDDHGPIGVFARYLRLLTYLPAMVACDDPDNLTGVGVPVSAHYLRWNSAALMRSPLPENPRIAVAPLAEYGSDVMFVPSACRTKYAMSLAYDERRLATALARALEADVHILLIPEMALPEGELATFDRRIGDLLLDAQEEYWDRNGKRPNFRLLIAGVLGAERADGRHRNYAVMFDADGHRLAGFEQRKLSHWNLRQSEQQRFGIDHHHPAVWPLSDPIAENSLPADRLTVLDIPGMGRTATFICADMSQNNPADWLAVNAILDCIFAPIMDKSICWEASDARREPRPWIVGRTYRAARMASTLVIATNNLSLTRWINAANARAGNGRHLNPGGIGLAIDGRRSPPTYARVDADVAERGICKVFETPWSHWRPFPVPPK